MMRSHTLPLSNHPARLMVPLICVLLLLAAAGIPSVEAYHWTEEQVVDETGNAFAAEVEPGPEGIVHVAWMDRGYWDDPPKLLYRQVTDMVWSEPDTLYLAYGATSRLNSFSAVCDEAGVFHVAFCRHVPGPYDGTDEIFYQRWSEGVWSESEEVTETYGPWERDPAITIDSFGTPTLVFIASTLVSGDYEYRIILVQRNEGGWSPQDTLYVSPQYLVDPKLAVDTNGLIHVTWTQYDPGEMTRTYTSRFDGVEWSPAEPLNDGPDDKDQELAATPDGSVHLVWVRRVEDPLAVILRHRLWNGLAWQPYEQLTPDTLLAINDTPSLTVGPAGELHLVWAGLPEPGDFGAEIFHRYWLGSSWTAPERVTDLGDTQDSPAIGVDPNGHAHVVWSYVHPGDTPWDLYYSRGVTPVSADGEGVIRDAVRVRAFPNPACKLTRFRLDPSLRGPVRLEILDPTGRRVRSLLLPQSGGVLDLLWDGKDDSGRALSGGVYLYRLRGERFEETGRLIRLR